MDADYHFYLLKSTRENFLRVINKLSPEQLNTIPEGFNNNLAWNLGHVLVTQQLLCYNLSGNKVVINEDWIHKYRKGTKPMNLIEREEIDDIKELLVSTVDILQKDYEQGLFLSFQEYSTSYGVTLQSIEEAISFNLAHEAMHLGSMIMLRKFVS